MASMPKIKVICIAQEKTILAAIILAFACGYLLSSAVALNRYAEAWLKLEKRESQLEIKQGPLDDWAGAKLKNLREKQ